MNAKQLLMGTLVIGVVWNILDFIIQGMLLKSTYAGITGFVSMDSISPVYWILIDFLGALILVWFYGKVMSSFERGTKGAVLYGIYFGFITSIPANIFPALTVKDFPSWLAFLWTVMFIIYGAIAGYILGMMNKPKAVNA